MISVLLCLTALAVRNNSFQSQNLHSNAYDRLAAAIEAGQNIDGVGELAYAFELGGLQLWAFWGNNYYLTVTVNGVDDSASALGIAKEAAQIVIGQF